MFRSSRLSRVLSGTVTLICHVSVTLAPSLAFAQEGQRGDLVAAGSMSRVDGGGSLSSGGDRSSAATQATGAARALAPTSASSSDGQDDVGTDAPGQVGSVLGDGSGAVRDDSGQNDDELVSGPEGENDGSAQQNQTNDPAPATSTLGLPSGDDKSGVTSQTISIPKGAGSIQGMEESFSAQLSTGIATFSVPFALMKARGGVSPSLGLSYSSGGGSGPAGQGWSVGVPFIARQTDRGLPQYKDGCNASTAPGYSCNHSNAWHPEQDRFVFNGGQELVPICTVKGGACSGVLTADASAVSGIAGGGSLAGVAEAMPSWAEGYQYFRPRVEGSFLRFFWSPDHKSWIVQDKSGTIMELGSASAGPAPGGLKLAGDDALERNPRKNSEIYRWHLARQYDQHIQGGVPLNLVVYDYMQQGGQAYVTDIYDTSPAGEATSTSKDTFAHHTRLRWEARPDVTEGYRSGWLMRSELRLSGVDVTAKSFFAGPSAARRQVRRYHLDYSAAYHRSLLTAVQVEGRCGAGEDDAQTPQESNGQLAASTSCGLLPPMSFDYSQVEGYETDGTKSSAHLDGYMPFDGRVTVLKNSPDHSIDEGLTDFFDINSDGLPDVLVTAPGLYGNGHAFFENGSGGQLGFSGPQLMGLKGVLGADGNTLKLSNLNVSPQDVDGDGIVNLLHMPRYKEYAIYDPRKIGDKWTWVGREVKTASGQNVKIDFGNDTLDTQIADINFDGLIDVIVSTGTEYQTFFSLGRYPGGDGQYGLGRYTGASSATIDNDPVTTCVPHSGLPVRFSDADVKMSDMNGDGILDIVRVRRGDIQYWPGRGNGYFGTGDRNDCPGGEFQPDEYKEMDDAPQYSDIEGSTLRLNDVNGDGLDDLVQVRFDAVDIWLNVDGKGWSERFILDDTPKHAGYHQRVRLNDVNGSGTPDIVWGDAKSYKYIDLQGGKKPYLLVGVKNGLGKSTELQYSTSTQEMLSAADTGNACGKAPESDRFAAAWCSVMPAVTHVVKRVIERDNITIRGRSPAAYITEYEYRDPVYEGRQREFRGFARARARRIGDTNSPTDVSESVFLLGECRDPADGSLWDGVDQKHYCAPPNRWADNAFEALKGLPVETHKMDAAGVHLASTENQYTIRTLYDGLDGRAVRHAFLSQSDSLLYDTGAASPGRVGIERRGFVDDEYSADWDAAPEPSGPSAYAAGMAHLRTSSVVDVFGNKVQSTSEGCVGGSECPQSQGLAQDESISQVTLPKLVPHAGNWMWRTAESYAVGSSTSALRGHSWTDFDELGRPIRNKAELIGIGAAGNIVRKLGAGLPGGAATEGIFTQSRSLYDQFGNAVRSRGSNGRCAEVAYDVNAGYALFATSETIATSGNTQDNSAVENISAACSPDLVTSASYDHGLGVVTLATDLNLRDTKAVYDQFGRITALHKPSATKAGGAAASYQDAPSVSIKYYLPSDLGGTPHSIIFTQTQDGSDETDTGHQIQSYAYVDGFGRTLVTLSEADPSSGPGGGHDGGGWIAGSMIEWDGKSAVAKKFMPFFWSGNPMAFDYASQVTTKYGRQRYDAFGRQVQTYDLDGTITLQSRYHALSTDLWDAADLTPGQHQHSYASERKDGHGRTVQTTERFRASGNMEQRHVQTSYLPTGEPVSISRVRSSGGSPIVRWMRYDSLGRMLLNVEPNTTAGYTADPNAEASTIHAWRYQYNFAGDLIATSDARGCGQNFYYDGAGRILGEDYAPCEIHQADYTAPISATDYENLEVSYFYDSPANVPAGVAPSGWTGSVGGSFTLGRAIAVLDRGSASFTSFDGRGRSVRSQMKICKPSQYSGVQAQQRALSDRYAPRVYERNVNFDAADREVAASTGLKELSASTGNASLDNFLSQSGESKVTTAYSARGAVKSAGSSYGSLVSDIVRTADNLVTSITYGDAAGTATAYLYDERRRISSVQTYRGPPSSGYWTQHDTSSSSEPTQQMVLQDEDFLYDVVGNPVEIRDWRDPSDWPDGAKPVTKKIEYDDLYRATRIRYDYADGDDAWVSPFAAENGGDVGGATSEAPKRAKPSPHVGFDRRILEQTFQYDWVGNNKKTTDDADGFYDRSLGDITNDSASDKPYQLRSAELDGARGGELEVRYDDAGNMVKMALQRSGPCLGGVGSSCNQQFDYQWDEVGRLVRARRWDGNTQSVDTFDAANAGNAAADLRYVYDASDQRVIKEAVDPSAPAADQKSYTLYIFSSLELRRTQFGSEYVDTGNTGSDYELSHWTVSPYLMANGVRLARLVYHGEDAVPEDGVASGGMPGDVNASTSQLHVFFELGDHLGSTSVVLDKATGELVERATFQGYGGAESDYRPGRWGNFREDYRFTGKEEDVEVGLTYFGKRYLNPLLGRWISADPLAIHAPGEADLNVYAYVSGQVLRSIDPLGLDASEAQRQVESENNLQNYFDPQSRQNQSCNQSPGGTSPAPSGDGNSYNSDKEYNNGIGDSTAAPFTNPHDPLNGNLGGAKSADPTNSTPNEKLGVLGNLSAAAGVLSGEDPLSDAPNASPLGIPGGAGPKAHGSRAAQAAYITGVAASEGWFGRLWSGAKKLWGKIEKIGDVFRARPASVSAAGGGAMPPGPPGGGDGGGPEFPRGGARSAAQGAQLNQELAAKEISGGHAFLKHVVERGEFPGIRTRAEFAQMIENTISNASHVKHLSGGRTAFWRNGVVVIRHPRAVDGGTAFAPASGFKYFEGLR